MAPGAGCPRGHPRPGGDEAGCPEATSSLHLGGFSRGPRPLRPILAASPRQRSRCKKSLQRPPRACREKWAFLAFFFPFSKCFVFGHSFFCPTNPIPNLPRAGTGSPHADVCLLRAGNSLRAAAVPLLTASLINLINQPVLVQSCEAPCSCPWPLCGCCPHCDPHPLLGACGKWERCENHPNSAKFLLLCAGQGWALLDQRLAGLRSCFLMPVAGNGLGGH